MNEKINKKAKIEKFNNMLGIAVRLIVIDPFVMREALFKIYTWILCLSYLHEKQTSRIKSLYLYFYQNCPVLAMKYPF